MARARSHSHKRTAAAAIAGGLSAWLMLGSSPRTPEQELLPNGSFETFDDAGMPVGWTPDFPKIAGQEPPRVTVDAAAFTDGAASACIANATEDPAAFAAWLAKVPEVPVDGYVELTGKVRTRDVTGAAFVMLQFWEHFDYGRYRLPHHSSEVRLNELRSTDWRPFHLTAHVPTGTTLITVRCCLMGSGAAWFDELSLHPIDIEAPPMGRDLLSNPGMEDADGLAPASWHTYGPFDGATEFGWDAGVRHSGGRSLAIAASSGSGFRWWEQWVSALRGPGAYRLSGFVRTADLALGSRAMLILNVYDDSGEQVALARAFDADKPGASRDWVRVSAEVRVPDGARSARVVAFLGGPGRAWFDDVELRAAE